MSIPVICDRCRITGIAGHGDFSHLGDLLDFTPVLREQRVDGWSPDKQRAFIAALATTGSPTRAAKAVGMSPFGATNLRKAAGAEGFNAAYARALAIAKAHGSMRIANGLADVAARDEFAAPGGRHDEADEAAGMDDSETIELLGRIVAKFTRKVAQERSARLAGDVVGADFTLRQITSLEVAFDLMCTGHGFDAWEKLYDIRRSGHGILQIADTDMSRILDDARRAQWEEMGEPPRPEHPPARYLTDHGDHRTQGRQFEVGEDRPGREEEQRARIEMQAREAKDQVEWESAQRRVDGERRESDASPSARAEKRPAAARAKRSKRNDAAGFTPAKQLPAPEEDFETRMMRKAIETARKAHPEDFD